MSMTKTATANALRSGADTGSVDMMFDYKAAARAARISSATLKKIEMRVRREFPDDPMLMELHVLRAIRAEAGKKQKKG